MTYAITELGEKKVDCLRYKLAIESLTCCCPRLRDSNYMFRMS